MEETKQENQETAEEPVQSPPVKRVTEKVRDPKKVAAGRAGAAARKTHQEERLLQQLRVAKEPFRPPPPPPPPHTHTAAPANISPPSEADQAVSQPERREGLTNWAPWVIGACLAGGALVFLRQTRSPATGPVDSAPMQPAPDAKQLKTRDPFYME